MKAISVFSFLLWVNQGFVNGYSEGKGDSVCPLAEQIYPCTCSKILNDLNLRCRGPTITQESIANAIQTLRGGIDDNHWFAWNGWLTINSTSLTSLDLSPFINTYIEWITIEYNSELELITGPTLETNAGKIGTKILKINYHPKLNDAGLGNTLVYFNHQVEQVQLERNSLEGYLDDSVELVKGMNSLNITVLRLWENKIRRLKVGSFKNMTRIATLELGDNLIEEVFEDTFELNENHNPSYYTIFLSGNPLNNEKVHPNFVRNKATGRVQLYFMDCKFETFSKETFEPLVSAFNRFNVVQVARNPIICDSRLKWLKDNADNSQYRLAFLGGNCANDPGKTVFNSDLIQ